ncbi:hypothetical protein M1247_14760 [Mycobacterium sp. 21AC1]|uniref:hypothetical protein n=1 Tax=[Mycobacterium] appelbergii TaxID=2939269 RepID=UPI002938EC8D|nr:hypothetical protein [Mycobacterium sp. 21AC1]MDV3126181.1 hypothetical protein [Mycobacterium sp. 21AC1]
MTLTDPRDALADESSFVGYLVGLTGLGRTVHVLADSGHRSETRCEADRFIDLLLGIASLGDAIERLAEPNSVRPGVVPPPDKARWLR